MIDIQKKDPRAILFTLYNAAKLVPGPEYPNLESVEEMNSLRAFVGHTHILVRGRRLNLFLGGRTLNPIGYQEANPGVKVAKLIEDLPDVWPVKKKRRRRKNSK